MFPLGLGLLESVLGAQELSPVFRLNRHYFPSLPFMPIQAYSQVISLAQAMVLLFCLRLFLQASFILEPIQALIAFSTLQVLV